GMDGFDMIDAMRKSGVEAPIAIQTSYVTREMVKELLASRICKVLVKPIGPDALISFVEKTAVVS
ncbi:MAG: hypothetical protein O2954_18860, partial [bacterium]|nr:hypothetical protein [bacterium]